MFQMVGNHPLASGLAALIWSCRHLHHCSHLCVQLSFPSHVSPKIKEQLGWKRPSPQTLVHSWPLSISLMLNKSDGLDFPYLSSNLELQGNYIRCQSYIISIHFNWQKDASSIQRNNTVQLGSSRTLRPLLQFFPSFSSATYETKK